MNIIDNAHGHMVEVRNEKNGKLLGFIEFEVLAYASGIHVHIPLRRKLNYTDFNSKEPTGPLDEVITLKTTLPLDEVITLKVLGLSWSYEGTVEPVPQLSCSPSDWKKLLKSYRD